MYTTKRSSEGEPNILNNSFLEDLRHSTVSFINSAKSVCGSNWNKRFHSTIDKLRKNTDIKICSFDKGNGIVIVNTSEYYEKLDCIVSDTSKFAEIKRGHKNHPIVTNENKICAFLRKNVKPFISSDIFEDIYPSGSQPGKLYGLCKVHKENYPFRPVVSMIGTAEYKLAKYLDQIIKPHIPSKYMLSSTWEFLDKLKLFIFKPSDCMISFDVISLFTNVPLIETIDIISDYVYKSKSKPAFSKLVFKELLNIATSGIFMYNGRLYRQVDGVTMGSPLGPTISNFCLAHLENELLSVSKFKPELYLRYVDDIFCVFRDQSTYENFFQQLSELHSSLKFTFEIGPKILPFLDAKI